MFSIQGAGIVSGSSNSNHSCVGSNAGSESDAVSNYSSVDSALAEEDSLESKFDKLGVAIWSMGAGAESDAVHNLLINILKTLQDKGLVDNLFSDEAESHKFAEDLIQFIHSQILPLADKTDNFLQPNSKRRIFEQELDKRLKSEEAEDASADFLKENYRAVFEKIRDLNAQLDEECPTVFSSWKKDPLKIIFNGLVELAAFVFGQTIASIGSAFNMEWKAEEAIKSYKIGFFQPSKAVLKNINLELLKVRAQIV